MSRDQELIRLLVVLAAGLASLTPIEVSGSADLLQKDIEVRISVAKDKLTAGEAVPIKVEIWNHSDKDLFVGKGLEDASGFMSRIAVVVEDAKGNLSPGLSRHATQFPVDPNESFASGLAKDWVLLPPGHFFGRIVEISSHGFEFLKIPGRYRLTVTYVCYGMRAPFYFNRVRNPDEVAKLPYRDWSGEVESNSVWIEIVPGKPRK